MSEAQTDANTAVASVRGIGLRQRDLLRTLIGQKEPIQISVGGNAKRRNVYSKALKGLEKRGIVVVKREGGRAIEVLLANESLALEALR